MIPVYNEARLLRDAVRSIANCGRLWHGAGLARRQWLDRCIVRVLTDQFANRAGIRRLFSTIAVVGDFGAKHGNAPSSKNRPIWQIHSYRPEWDFIVATIYSAVLTGLM